MKKLLALATTALLSTTASAGYVQYDLTGPISGHFIQHDDDQSIAYFRFSQLVPGTPGGYEFRMNLFPVNNEGGTGITATTTHFRNNGPTNFRVGSDFGADQTTYLDVTFSRSTQGKFEYSATYANSILFCGATGCGYESFSGSYTGQAARGTVNPLFAQYLDSVGGYEYPITRSVPTYVNPNAVPEPGSFALLAIGALGFAGLRRRKPE